MSACASVQDQLPELALGVLDGAARADVLDHLETCPRCRASATGYAATADALALLAPEAEPPAGFVERTQERLRSDRSGSHSWPRRRVVALLAAAAALLVIATLATVRIVDASGDPAVPGRVHEVAMIGGDDDHVGRVYATEAPGEDFLFVSVDYGVDSGRYAVDVASERGVVRVGTMTIADGRGEWAGPSGGTDGPPTAVRLVDTDGTAVCTARFATPD